MTTYTNYTINETGLAEILDFLGEYHRKGRDHFDREMLHAWDADAELHLGEGNPASIEIPAYNSVTGAAVTYTISDAGIDVQEVEDD